MAAAAEFHAVTVENFLIFSREGHAHLELVVYHGSEVADKEQGLVFLLRLAQEDGDVLRRVVTLDPLKAVGMEIHLAEGRILLIHLIQRLHIFLHLAVDGILQKSPLQLLILIPLVHLAEFLAHEQQFLARMAQHKAVGRPQVGKLLLVGRTRHLVHQGSLAVHHFVMGEHQDEILAVSVDHAEGQLSVVVISEIGVALHIAQEIVHPSHVPLIVKAQAVVPHIPGDLRPGRGLLRDEYGSVLFLLENGIQVL